MASVYQHWDAYLATPNGAKLPRFSDVVDVDAGNRFNAGARIIKLVSHQHQERSYLIPVRNVDHPPGHHGGRSACLGQHDVPRVQFGDLASERDLGGRPQIDVTGPDLLGAEHDGAQRISEWSCCVLGEDPLDYPLRFLAGQIHEHLLESGELRSRLQVGCCPRQPRGCWPLAAPRQARRIDVEAAEYGYLSC
jgi:hypothetical protein